MHTQFAGSIVIFLQLLSSRNMVCGTGCCLGGNRRDCHPDGGATQSDCEAEGCLWCPLPSGTPGPWCTHAGGHLGNTVRVDCYPEPGATPHKCRQRGCLWCKPPDLKKGEPWCIFDSNDKRTVAGYNARNVVHYSNGITASLARRHGPTISGSPVENLNLQIRYESNYHLHISMSPSSSNKKPGPLKNENRVSLDSRLYSIDIQQSPFGIAVKRSSTNALIFDTRNIPGPIVENQYLMINTLAPSRNIYGFGEQLHPNLRHDLNWNKLPMFSRDQPVYSPNYNMYGVHPFYLVMENDGNALGVVFINSHAQRATLKPNPAIQYETIGGKLEFRLFLGPTPDQVIQQYLQFIGKPMLPPYWSLGFHLCRYGYTSLDNVKQVHDRMVKSGIPYETQWVDIDYMEGYKDFTYDQNKWIDLPAFSKQLHNEHRHFVTILDPAIKSRTSDYSPLEQAVQQNVFLKHKNGNVFEGSVWPGCSYFPDFSCSHTKTWWTHWLTQWNSSVASDGLWIDMNEPSNAFCPASHSADIPYCDHCTTCKQNKWNKPPIIPLPDQDINDKTVCMDAQTCIGDNQYREHNKYGHYEAIATHDWPTDSQTYGIQDQFMWGKSLMIVPIMTPRTTHRSAYFPAGRWFDYYNGCVQSSIGETFPLNIPISRIGLFIYGGTIIPWQEPSATTYESRKQPFGLTVSLNKDHFAEGDLIWDDGVSSGPNNQLVFHMNASSSLTSKSGILNIHRIVNNYSGADRLKWASITFHGLYRQPDRININGSPYQGYRSYDSTCNTLKLTGLVIPFSSGATNIQTVEWFYN